MKSMVVVGVSLYLSEKTHALHVESSRLSPGHLPTTTILAAGLRRTYSCHLGETLPK